MFSDVTRSYDLSDATFEILFMLVVAFLLGYLLAWVLNKKSASKEITTTYVQPEKQVDNLKIIEGVGPKIEELLNKAKIYSFVDVINADIKGLQQVLDDAGTKFQMHNPKTWPDQAELAHEGRWAELKEYQDLLNSGRES